VPTPDRDTASPLQNWLEVLTIQDIGIARCPPEVMVFLQACVLIWEQQPSRRLEAAYKFVSMLELLDLQAPKAGEAGACTQSTRTTNPEGDR
jgi:hypothetical protein